jgi:hypothetical protein
MADVLQYMGMPCWLSCVYLSPCRFFRLHICQISIEFILWYMSWKGSKETEERRRNHRLCRLGSKDEVHREYVKLITKEREKGANPNYTVRRSEVTPTHDSTNTLHFSPPRKSVLRRSQRWSSWTHVWGGHPAVWVDIEFMFLSIFGKTCDGIQSIIVSIINVSELGNTSLGAFSLPWHCDREERGYKLVKPNTRCGRIWSVAIY